MILNTIKKNVDKFGETSIRSVAESITFDKLSLTEQKRLAKLVVKENPFITEIRQGEVFVKLNKQYNPEATSHGHKTLIKLLIGTLAGILIYLIFHIILPLLQ